jgi:hypothetical protein
MRQPLGTRALLASIERDRLARQRAAFAMLAFAATCALAIAGGCAYLTMHALDSAASVFASIR